MKTFGIICVLVCMALLTEAQEMLISGTVLDSTRRYIVPAVKVTSTSGHITYTDSSGSYNILVKKTDSINFTYRNKSTVWFPVADIKYGYPFDISLQVNELDSLLEDNPVMRVFTAPCPVLPVPESDLPIGIP